MDESKEIPSGVTRRQALRRGLLIGTGVLWATPVVQVLGVSKAYAQTPSPVESGDSNGQGPGNHNDDADNSQSPGTEVTNPNVEQTPGSEEGGGAIPQGPGKEITGGDAQPLGDEVGGVQVQQTQTPSVIAKGPVTETEAETIPLTGIEVLPLATLGGGLLAVGAATLKIAKQMEGSDLPNHSGPEPPEDG